ncbi:monocarboxylate transporter 6, partial [Aplysia californica]|uniref:Monocarboxylate transporter 6 n=1 Tax=Aplysia californica TaxID=6500 RepID=A0ABM1A7T4_APLCA
MTSRGEAGPRRWLVLAMSFVNLLVNGSLNYHVGVLNLALLDNYHADPLLTSWLMSLYVSLFALGGPVSSVIIDMFSCRVCVFMAGVLGLVGMAGSYLVTDPAVLFLTLTIAGIGQSLSFVGGSLVLSFYFPDMMTIANGVYFCGAGLGTFIHPP